LCGRVYPAKIKSRRLSNSPGFKRKFFARFVETPRRFDVILTSYHHYRNNPNAGIFLMPEHFENTNTTASSTDFSMSKFVHEAYDKGLVKAVVDHPKEAAVTAVGALALTAIAGKSLAKEELSSVIRPASDDLVARGMPITAEARVAAANPDILSMAPWHREGAIRGAANYFESRERAAAFDDLIAKGMPTTPNRAAAANTSFLRQAVGDRGSAVRGVSQYLKSLE
jgi:hypothetical protein